jgi:hypothetical protein
MGKDKEIGNLATHAYTYEVVMVVQILAEDEKEARSRLDGQGGYVTARQVTLKDTVALFNGKEKDK